LIDSKLLEPGAPAEARAPDSLRCSLLVEFDQNLGVALDSLVELVVGIRSFLNLNAVTDDLAGLGPSVHNQITKILVVLLDWRLTTSHGYALVEEIGNRKGIDALLRIALRAWIRSDVHTNEAHMPGGIYDFQATLLRYAARLRNADGN
jgi:hypothetical protein